MGTLIPAFIIIVAVAIFSVQNASPTSIAFLFWKFEASLAIVIFISVLTGMAIASSIFFWLRVRQRGKDQLQDSPPPDN